MAEMPIVEHYHVPPRNKEWGAKHKKTTQGMLVVDVTCVCVCVCASTIMAVEHGFRQSKSPNSGATAGIQWECISRRQQPRALPGFWQAVALPCSDGGSESSCLMLQTAIGTGFW